MSACVRNQPVSDPAAADDARRAGDPGDGGGGARSASDIVTTASDVLGDSANLQPLDVRALSAFTLSHAAAALHLSAAELRATVDGIGGQVSPPEPTAQSLSAAGVDWDAPIVVYDAQSSLAAARTVWTLRYYGHPDARMLDGGLDAYEAFEGRLESGEPSAEASDVGALAPVEELRVDAQWVLDHLNDPSVTLIDARSESEYAAGHIPGALSFDWTRNVEDGSLKPLSELRAMYTQVPADGTIIVYCQTGSRAAMGWLSLVHLGYRDVRLYDGSMADWTTDSSRPLER